MSRGLSKKTKGVITQARAIMEENQPHRMTLRQVFYRLVSIQAIENDKATYTWLGKCLVTARKSGAIPWEWLEDRTRRPRCVSTWDNLSDFLETVAGAYHRDIWPEQPRRIEVWLEKDTLSGIFEDALAEYRIPLNVSRGFDGWSSIYEASERLEDADSILYFSDFDPSGEDMKRSLEDRLAFFDCRPTIRKVALTFEDVQKYQLPPNRCKAEDLRSRKHVEKYGDVSVELDALPPAILVKMIHDAVCSEIDLPALERTKSKEAEETASLNQALAGSGL
jgi:hypothetical protein